MKKFYDCLSQTELGDGFEQVVAFEDQTVNSTPVPPYLQGVGDIIPMNREFHECLPPPPTQKKLNSQNKLQFYTNCA